MRIISFLIAFFLLLSACGNNNTSVDEKKNSAFNRDKWMTEIDDEYPYREHMLDSVVYNDTIRRLNEKEILQLLGDPDYINEGYFYYTISRKRLGSWILHTKSMVIKISPEGTIEWIKIHE